MLHFFLKFIPLIPLKHIFIPPKFNSEFTPEKWMGWKTILSWEGKTFRGRTVSLREVCFSNLKFPKVFHQHYQHHLVLVGEQLLVIEYTLRI